MKSLVPTIEACEIRRLLTADISLTTSVRTSQIETHAVDFWIGGGAPVSFAFTGTAQGSISSVQPGQYRYTPDIDAVGIDNFAATYQPGYGGGYGGYGPPPVTTTFEMKILFPFGASNDDRKTNGVNYYVLEGNSLTVSAADGVLRNDTNSQFVQYLTAHQVDNGQLGSFTIGSDGGFTYTPNSAVFDAPTFAGLEDTCRYYAMDSMGNRSTEGVVTVDLTSLKIKRYGYPKVGTVGYYPLDTEGLPEDSSFSSPWVGERVALTASVMGQADDLQFAWQVPSRAVKGYTGSSTTTEAAVDELAMEDLLSANIAVYFVNQGQKTVALTARGSDQQASVSESLNVQRPCSSFTATIYHWTEHTANGVTYIELGDLTANPAIPGIAFYLSSDAGGDYRLEQTVESTLTRTHNGVTQTVVAAGVDAGRIREVEYSKVQVDSAEAFGDPLWNDSPLIGYSELVAGTTAFSRSDQFKSTLMYKPGLLEAVDDDSIWVPLQKIEWTVGASLTQQNGVWQWQATGGPYDTTLSGADTLDFPYFSVTLFSQLPIDWFNS